MASILVVDDDRDISSLLADILEAEGHTVRTADDGELGLRALHEQIPELVLLDVEMPRLTGPDMAYRMFVEDCGLGEVPIVLLSGVADLGTVAAAVGTPYFLGKPYDVAGLLALVERALTERRLPSPALQPSNKG